MKHIAALVVFIAVTVTPDMMGAQNQRAPFRPVADAMLEKPDPANWPMWRRTLDSWGFSPLDHVNRSNVSQLRMVWSRAMGPGNVQEATPLVYDGVMYVPNPNDYITAFEADTGRLLWEYHASCLRISESTCRSSLSTATWRSTATRSSTRARTISSLRWTRRPASSHGKPRSSTTTRARNRAPGPSSPGAK